MVRLRPEKHHMSFRAKRGIFAGADLYGAPGRFLPMVEMTNMG